MPEAPTTLSRTDRFDLRALYETSRLLSQSLDLGFVLNSLLLTVMSKLFVTRGAVFIYDPLESAYRASTVRGVKALEEGELIRFDRIHADRLMLGDELPHEIEAKGMSLAMPICFDTREIGLLAVGSKATRQPFTPQELEFIRSLVNMSSTAVHNSLMVEELKQANRDLDAKIQELNTLFDLSQEFNATIDRKRLSRLLSFALMGQMLVSRHVFLMRRSQADGGGAPEVHVVAAQGLPGGQPAPDVVASLCKLERLVLLQDGSSDGEAWPALLDLGLTLALPLRQHGETRGVLGLGPKRTGNAYTPGDLEFLSALGNLVLVSIENSFLVEEQIEKERLEEEMRLARRIQERLLPQSTPAYEGYELAALALPSHAVGGDYYDLIPLEGDRLMLAIADVTGKGMPASLLMANLQACLHALVPIDITIEEAAANINRVISENTDFDKFITYFHGILHRDATLTYVNAGHNPPMLLRKSGELELLEEGGLLLGVMKNLTYKSGSVKVEKGDVLALFTDGVTEAMSTDGEEYAEERLEACLREHAARSAPEILTAIRDEIATFTGSTSMLSDDLTLVVMKRTD